MADKAGLKPPKTWSDLLANAKALTQSTKGDGKIDIYGITLPGDNLFINILMGELIKSNGGALFDKSNKPLLTDKKMIEVLEFWRELVKYAPPGWEGHGYLQTFQNLYGQKAAMMFQGYGRGAGLIEKFAPKEMANDKTFDVWSKPIGPSGKEPGVQVDEEPWMLFKDAKHQKEAIEFLKFFYQDDNYLEYVSTVPIHLFPITKSLRASPKYQNLEMIQRWKGWIEVQQSYLDKDQGKPTLGHRLVGYDGEALSARSARFRHHPRHGHGRGAGEVGTAKGRRKGAEAARGPAAQQRLSEGVSCCARRANREWWACIERAPTAHSARGSFQLPEAAIGMLLLLPAILLLLLLTLYPILYGIWISFLQQALVLSPADLYRTRQLSLSFA